MKTKIIYISGSEVFEMADVRAAFNEVRNTLGLGADTVLFGVPVDADDAIANHTAQVDTHTATDTVAEQHDTPHVPLESVAPVMESEPIAPVAQIESVTPAEPVEPTPVKKSRGRPRKTATPTEPIASETISNDATPENTGAEKVIPILSILAGKEAVAAPADAADATPVADDDIVDATTDDAELAIADADAQIASDDATDEIDVIIEDEATAEIDAEEIVEEIEEEEEIIEEIAEDIRADVDDFDEQIMDEMPEDVPETPNDINDEIEEDEQIDARTEKTLEQLLESMTPLHDTHAAPDDEDVVTHTAETVVVIADDTDATLEQLAAEFATNADTIKPATRHGKISNLKNILPFKRERNSDTGLMGDLFGWAGVANDEDFSIPGFFTAGGAKK